MSFRNINQVIRSISIGRTRSLLPRPTHVSRSFSTSHMKWTTSEAQHKFASEAKPSHFNAAQAGKDVKPSFQEKRGETLQNLLKSVTVQEMLDKKGKNTVVIVDENQTVYEAVKAMSDHDIGAVVVSAKGKPRGIFTERDYMTKLILKGRDSQKTPIKEVTEYQLSTVKPDTTLDQCADLMIKKIIRHLPIVGQDGSLVGMMSVRDVAEHMVNAGFLATDLQLDKNPDTVEDVFNQLGRVSSEECFVQSSDSVLKALELMEKHRIGAVFVLEGQTLAGIFTERDYLHRVRLQEKASRTTTIEEVMTSKVVVVSPAEKIGKCLDVMLKGKFRHLPVVPMVGDQEVDCGEYRTVLGIITLVDVVRFLYRLGSKQ
ncbi:signal transduction protein [Planoprotostelium fungivorum]|uniref:Signal transduction protein n=1 Tax=Planoprotostelium fungivorum TaxID=1890364 RepID=A0A2P6NAL0_9EUKA|nr:signal transduction protein [Planoprotostelium fungivorum]